MRRKKVAQMLLVISAVIAVTGISLKQIFDGYIGGFSSGGKFVTTTMKQGQVNHEPSSTSNVMILPPLIVDVVKNEVNDTTTPKNTSSTHIDRTIVYLHVGKTGGTSLNKAFRANCEWLSSGKGKCFEQLIQPETVISHLTKKQVHAQIRKNDPFFSVNATSYLFTIRNPIARAISAYNMDHPKNSPQSNPYFVFWKTRFYEKCFPFVEDIASVLLDKFERNETKTATMPAYNAPNDTSTIDCTGLAQEALQGKAHVLTVSHLSTNYRFYANPTFIRHPEKEIFVVRTENLWNDIDELNTALAGTLVKYGEVYNATILENKDLTATSLAFKNVTGYAMTHGSGEYKVKSGLSKKGKEIICCHLSEENQIFEDLVRRAANLDSLEKNRYLDGLYSDCGITEANQREFEQGDADEKEEGHHGSFDWSRWSDSIGCKF